MGVELGQIGRARGLVTALLYVPLQQIGLAGLASDAALEGPQLREGFKASSC
jgi:hypothetical protein